MKVLVTGGAGFIGSHIVDELVKENYEVVVIDNLITGNQCNLPLHVKFYKADIRGRLDDIFLLEKPDYVIHQAAQVSVAQSISEPLYDGEENILGTINLLNASIKYQVKKFIFASTAAVYGSPTSSLIDETHAPNPISFYGLSKLHAEAYIQLFSNLYPLNYTILRYANVYGMRQDTKGEAGVIAIFIQQALHNQPPTVYGDGLQTRDFIFVKDIAKANIAALHHGNREIFNISTGSETTVLDVIKQLNIILNTNVMPIFQKEREGDIKHSCLSNHKAKQQLNWKPTYTISAGLKETIDFYR